MDSDAISTSSLPLIDHSARTPQGSVSRTGESDEERPFRTPSHAEVSPRRRTTPPSKTVRKASVLPPLQWAIHGISIAFSTMVITLCSKEVYLTDSYRPNINLIQNAFQLVAKLHEVAIGTSLAAIATYELLYQLCCANGLPLGHLPTPFQLASIGLLFKKRFWIALTAKENSREGLLFGAGVLALTVLTALSGPSSAILVVPQLGWWHVNHPFSTVNGFTYLNASHEYMWPSQIDASIVPDTCHGTSSATYLNCPYAGYSDITFWAQEYLSQFSDPNITVLDNANMQRYLAASRYNDDGYSTSSTAMSHLSRDLGDIWLFARRHNISMAKFARPKVTLSSSNDQRPIMQPLVQAKCGTPQVMDNQDVLEMAFPTSNISVPGEPAFPEIVQRVNTSYYRSGSPTFAFTDISEQAKHPALGALVGMSFSNARAIPGSKFKGWLGDGLMACTVVAHWVPSRMAFDPNTANVVISGNPHPLDLIGSEDLMSQARKIDVDISYANAVSTWGSTPNVLEYELMSLAFKKSISHLPRYDGAWGKRWSYLVSTVISLQLADALARVKEEMAMMVLCEGSTCYQKGHPTLQDIKDQNNPVSLEEGITKSEEQIRRVNSHPKLFTPVYWKVQRYGLAWSFDTVGKWLALVVLLLHVIFVLGHLVLVFNRQWSSEHWSNLVELLALAVQSPPTTRLQGASSVSRHLSTDAAVVRIVRDENGHGATLTAP